MVRMILALLATLAVSPSEPPLVLSGARVLAADPLPYTTLIAFLDGERHPFREGAGAALATAPYAPAAQVDLDALLTLGEAWVRRNT